MESGSTFPQQTFFAIVQREFEKTIMQQVWASENTGVEQNMKTEYDAKGAGPFLSARTINDSSTICTIRAITPRTVPPLQYAP